ncbi:hypothetical protein LUCX_54 [Xanthomonas phage vB_XciM_LucasX]|nr:hypothetical protein LUCX_54 [Xanthomonas phage vB_XciM_LucasX]
MPAPAIVVLSGAVAYERVGRLLNSMVHANPDRNEFGRVLVELLTMPNRNNTSQMADITQHYLRQFILPGDDPGFDQQIVFEALTYGAHEFARSWYEQVPHDIPLSAYCFERWLNGDLVLKRR